MPITNFTVDFVNHPDGQYKASLKGKDQNGQPLKLSMGKHSLAPFQKGQTYLIEYSVKSFNRDDGSEVQYYAFEGIVNGGAEAYPGVAPAAGMQPVGQAAGSAISEAQKLRERAASLEKAEQQKTQALRAVEHETELKAAHIFVTGLVGRAAGNGLAEKDWPTAAVWAVKAWRAANYELEHPSGLQPSTVAAGGAPVGPIQSENPAQFDDPLPDEISY